jgi:hypothetical protein
MLREKEQQRLERLKKRNEDPAEEIFSIPRPVVEENPDQDKIIVKLRGKDNRDIPLRVKPVSYHIYCIYINEILIFYWFYL